MVGLLVLGLAAVALSACGSSPHTNAAATTVWLCRPGAAPDPCTHSLDVTTVRGNGTRSVDDVSSPVASKFDCFYLYPTVSTEPSDNSNLKIQRAERGVAIAQASPFSQVCRVWAPMYRQRTVDSLFKGLGGDPTGDQVAFESVQHAWNDYLKHDNDGRPVIFIGHSQGAAMLIRLLEKDIDPSAVRRALMVSAIIAGGNVTVADGSDVGGTFHHLALCTTATSLNCVIAYSSFPSEPPTTSLFGRPGQGVSLQSGQTAMAGVHVACVNPASLSGGTGALAPWFLASTAPPQGAPVTTPWVAYPGLYQAICMEAGGATWLQVAEIPSAKGPRPVVTEGLGPDWGFHADDISLAIGNLVDDVRRQEAAYLREVPQVTTR
jgi:hypothetical protein